MALRYGTLPKSLKKFEKLVMDVDRDPDGTYFIGLNTGWWNPMSETHMVVESTVAECALAFRDVEKCHCANGCKEHWEKQA